MDNFEADDLIATYARHAVEAGAEVTILSSDKDMMQLVHDGRVTMRDPMTDRPIGEAEVREKFGVGPDKVIEVQALCGDSTDNVPGVPGIGVKTAAELINAYGDLETLLARADEIKQPKRRQSLIDNEAQARLSKELVKLDDDVPLPCPLSALRVKPYDPEKLFPFLDEMELRALKSRIERRLSITAPTPTAGPSEPVVPEIPPFAAERTYAVVDTAEGLAHWIAAAVQAGAVAIWAAPSALAGRRPEFCGIALAVGPGLAAYVPLGHRAPRTGEAEPGLLELGRRRERHVRAPRLSPDAALALLKPLLEDPGVLKIGHDMKGMAHLLRRHGIAVAPYDCTMLMSYVLDGGQVEHTVEELTKRVPLARSDPGQGDPRHRAQRDLLCRGRDRAGARFRLRARRRGVAAARAAQGAAGARAHDRVLRDDRAADGGRGRGDGGCRGQGRSRRRSPNCREISRAASPRSRQSIWRDVGHEFNIGSTKQLGDVLFEKLQLPGGKKGKTGAYGTDASILETLAPLHPVPAQVLEWRQLTKLKSTYADALGENIDARNRPGAYLLRAGRDGDRAAVLVRAEHPEHPDPHRGRAKNPPRLCRRSRAICCCRPITARSNCGWRRMSPTSPS